MNALLQFLKKILGKNLTRTIRPLGHGLKAFLAACYFGFPARKLVKVGITATKAKTSTTVITGRMMNMLGIKTGYISTAVIYTGQGKEFDNSYKMTTIDGFALQQYLKEMVENNCTHVILEMSSQGLEQHRHWGLFGFDIGVFMNFYPEHIEAHGGLTNYQRAKSLLLQNIKKGGKAILTDKPEFKDVSNILWSYVKPSRQTSITKIAYNPDNEYTFVKNNADKFAHIVINGVDYKTNFFHQFETENIMFSLEICKQFVPTISSTTLDIILSNLQGVPGRMEFAVQSPDIDIVVDYAHETGSMEKLLKALASWKKQGFYHSIIHVLSCDGAGRDDWKKPLLGDISHTYADFTVVTTDNYTQDDNPQDIIDLLTKNFNKNANDYTTEINRKEAFIKALDQAKKLEKKILIVSTGVGSEYGLTQPHGVMSWDEVEEWKEIWKHYSR